MFKGMFKGNDQHSLHINYFIIKPIIKPIIRPSLSVQVFLRTLLCLVFAWLKIVGAIKEVHTVI